MADFELNILGCGSALPTTRHLASSQVIDLRDKLYMIDCGEGTQVQMRRMRIKFSRLNHIFISHLHGDHCFGLPGLISTLGMLGRNGDLFVYGPEGVGAYLDAMLRLFCQRLPFNVRFTPVNTQGQELVMEDRSVAVYSIPLRHRVPCCGFLFKEKQRDPHIIREMIDFYRIPVKELQYIKQGADYVTPDGRSVPNRLLTRPAKPARSYAYCADTAYQPGIVPCIRQADLLYHEATFLELDAARARKTFHSTAKEAAVIARDAEVKQLLIGHYSACYEDPLPLMQEAAAVFPHTLLAKEGLKINL